MSRRKRISQRAAAIISFAAGMTIYCPGAFFVAVAHAGDGAGTPGTSYSESLGGPPTYNLSQSGTGGGGGYTYDGAGGMGGNGGNGAANLTYVFGTSSSISASGTGGSGGSGGSGDPG